jgi:hypothetical protein
MSDQDFFKKLCSIDGAHLYGHGSEGGVWIGYLLSQDGGLIFGLGASWTNFWGDKKKRMNGGSYLFCGREPETTGDFLAKLKDFLKNLNGVYPDYHRYIFWFSDPNSAGLVGQYIPIKKLSNDKGQVVGIKRQDWIKLRNIQFLLDQGVVITLDQKNAEFQLTKPAGINVRLYNEIGSSYFGEVAPKEMSPVICIPLTEAASGAIRFDAALRADAEKNDFKAARVCLKYFCKDDSGDIRSQPYEVFAPLAAGTKIPFNVSLDPIHPLDHQRSNFAFAGTPPTFPSGFRLSLGHGVTLTPRAGASGLVFSAEKTRPRIPGKPQEDAFYLAPSGDFAVGLEDPEKFAPSEGRPLPRLLCGLSGLETIGFHANDVLTFIPDKEAFAPAFPVRETSLDDPDPAGAQPLLDGTFTTSWMRVNRPAGGEENFYFSQPEGAPLYARDQAADPSGILGHLQRPSARLGRELAYPMVPYGFVAADGDGFKEDEIPQFELQILSPFRRGRILFGVKGGARLLSEENPTPAATPQGFISYVEADGNWKSLLLARNEGEALELEDLDPALQAAFSTNQLFLVVTDPAAEWELESKDPAGSASGKTVFKNRISIGGWPFKINVGKGNSFNNYRNVLIFKFCDGTLAERVRNPKLWTDAEEFSDPRSGGPEAVSQWLQEYIADAAGEKGDYFKHFNEIINDGSWNGVLALKVDIDRTEFPPQLEALIGAIDDPDGFNVHHLGIDGSKVDGRAVDITTSSLFGLIYYSDPGYDGSGPVPPAPGAGYDFWVLTMKVLFESSAIKDFESLAQLTINRIFDHPVISTGDQDKLYNAILFNGSCQQHGGETVYVLDSVGDNSFYLDSSVLRKVEITKADFSTLGKNNGIVSSRFGLTGFLDFHVLKEGKGEGTDEAGGERWSGGPTSFDVFSFGNEDGKDEPRRGLGFSGLGLDMTYPAAESKKKEFRFDPTKIAFSLEKSTPRDKSLFLEFGLAFEGFVNGGPDSKPSDGGFLQVKTSLRQAGLSGPWQGLAFRLNMGTPGELAGKVSLTSSLLLAWSGGGSEGYNVFIGIKLPGTGGGAKLFDLQGVLKLSIGDVRLAYLKDEKGGRESFLLTLTEIALKFLGLAKLPPGGATSFYLFGNSDPGARGCGLGWYAMYKKSKDSMMNDGTSPQGIGEVVTQF